MALVVQSSHRVAARLLYSNSAALPVMEWESQCPQEGFELEFQGDEASDASSKRVVGLTVLVPYGKAVDTRKQNRGPA